MNKATIMYLKYSKLKYSINKVYATLQINVDDLRIRITAKVNILNENPEKVMRSMRKNAQVSVNRNDGQVKGRGQ